MERTASHTPSVNREGSGFESFNFSFLDKAILYSSDCP